MTNKANLGRIIDGIPVVEVQCAFCNGKIKGRIKGSRILGTTRNPNFIWGRYVRDASGKEGWAHAGPECCGDKEEVTPSVALRVQING